MSGDLFGNASTGGEGAGGKRRSTRPGAGDRSSAQPGLDPNAPPDPDAPLADRMRPQTFDELVGQPQLLEPGSPIALMREGSHLSSIILWGPPGTGKTTIARLIAGAAAVPFVARSAVLTGVKEVKEAMERAALERRGTGKPTVLFLDEIHRFNRAQQDAFLAHVERGDIVLIGATTENPSFEVNAALLSRARVLVLKELSKEDLKTLVERARVDPRGLSGRHTLEREALEL